MTTASQAAQTRAPADVPVREWRDLRVSLIIALCCLFVYNANGRAISAGDAIPSRYLPFAILGHGTVLIDPIVALTSQGRDVPENREGRSDIAFWIVPTASGHLVSLYSIELPVLLTPLYVPAVAYVAARGWVDSRIDVAARLMEKLAASLITALSAALLYLLLRRRSSRRVALLLTVAYAFGTSTWVISSQALWQHGMAQLLVTGLALCLTAPSTVPRTLAAGLLCGLIAGNRPPDAVISAALGVFCLYWAGRRAPLFVAAAAAPVALILVYNITIVGAVAGGYGLIGKADFLAHDLRSGLAGLLFSPTRGLFVFSPFLLFLVLAWRHLPPDRGERLLTLAMCVAVVVQLLLYAKTDWRAGISWGPRFMTDLLPLLIWMLAPVVAALSRPGLSVFVSAVAVSIAIESVGAFAYTGVTDLPIYAVPSGPNRMRAAWNWNNAPFIASLSHGRAPAELTRAMLGNLDAIEVDGKSVDAIVAGQQAVATGWALAGRATPLQVGITIDGTHTVAVRTFFDRPDVVRELPGTGLSGWRIPIDTTRLAPGEHRLALYLWASEKGEAYFLKKRTLMVSSATARSDGRGSSPADLDASRSTATARIREHQKQPGYWFTSYTTSTRFEGPHDEMNTYLTSLLVDLLEPVAAEGLRENLQRAREHLTAQIEQDGLVRYHGLPDGPLIGSLGCKITPDTDDTALVWRIAPAPDRRRLPPALAAIDGYRRPDGLYRTWLAPRAAYSCLDPGSDPNPADVVIQMHLLQLLAKERPAAGRALCEAMRRHLDEDQIWMYYRLAPLVPILRTTDLARAGCRFDLPAERTRTTVPEQEIWVSAVNLLMRFQSAGPRPDAKEVEAVLRQLADGDFARLRRNPPLLYHNDLSATVPRYYWSEDVGYALWLRLAAANEAP
jgi:hypothetical protein